MTEIRLFHVVAFLAMAVAVGSLGFIAELPSTTPYSPFNTGPRGYSLMLSLMDAELLTSLDDFNGSVIVPLTHELSEEEMAVLSRYVYAGGTVIVLDERGYSNNLLSNYLNVSIVVVPSPIYDYVLNYGSNASQPLVMAFISDENLTCYFGGPASVSVRMTAAIAVANTSEFSYRDVDRNGFFNLGDRFGPFTVVIGVRVGRGKIFVVTDLDVFSNELIEIADNSGLLKHLTDQEPVGIYLDGLNTSIVDYMKFYSYLTGGWVRRLAEFASLMVIAAVMAYGKKVGILE